MRTLEATLASPGHGILRQPALVALAVALATCLLLVWAGPARAQTPTDEPDARSQTPAPVQALLAKVRQAYEKIEAYDAQIDYAWSMTNGQSGAMPPIHVSFDRKDARFRVDRPDFVVAHDGQTVRFVASDVASHHVAASTPDPMVWDAVLRIAPSVAQPPLPDLMMLLKGDVLTGATAGSARLLDADDQGRPSGVGFATQAGQVKLMIDPATHLFTGVDLTLAQPGGESVAIRGRIEITDDAEAGDADRFKVDTGDSVAVASFDALRQALASARPAREAQRMVGQAAPDVKLTRMDGQPYAVADDKARVIIMDFWATWCGPCRMVMPIMQRVHQWTQDEAMPVAIYAVNIRESADTITNYLRDNDLADLPSLRDADADYAQALGIRSIPQSVVLVDGKIVNVHIGYHSGLEDELREEITALLAGLDNAPAAQ